MPTLLIVPRCSSFETSDSLLFLIHDNLAATGRTSFTRRRWDQVALLTAPRDTVARVKAASHLVDPAMPPILCSRWHLHARKIWIDDALGAAARCRGVALRQGGIATFVIVTPSPWVHVQANRISRIVCLGPSRRRRENRRDRQNCQTLNAHQSSFQIGIRWGRLFKVNSRSRVDPSGVTQHRRTSATICISSARPCRFHEQY